MKEFLVGFAKEDITPPVGTLLFGYPSIRPAERILDPLSAGAAVIVQGNKKACLISVEVACISPEMDEKIRIAVAEATQLDKGDILIASTHTHSGPLTRTLDGWGVQDEDYLFGVMLPACANAAKKALGGAKPAEMGIGSAETYVGMNRREVTADGQIALGQNPDGIYDPTLTAVTFRSESGESIGTILHVGIHPTSAGGNLSITRDWPGGMIDRVEEITGAPCIFFNGAEGNTGPRLSNGKTIGDDALMQGLASVAAEDAENAYRSITEFKVPELKLFKGKVLLPFVEPPTLEEVTAQLTKMGAKEDQHEVDIPKYAKLSRIKEMLEEGESFPKGIEMDVMVMALDEFAVVPTPFEAFCEISMEIKEKSPFANTVILGMANGSHGYLPTEEQIPYGGYEVAEFYAEGVLDLVTYTDKIFVEANVELLKKLKEEEA